MWSDDGVVLSDEKSPLFPGSDNEVRPYHSVAADNKDFKGDGNVCSSLHAICTAISEA